MPKDTIISNRWSRWGLALGGWTLLGTLFASQIFIDYAYAGHRISWSGALALALAQWYLWAVLSIGILRLTYCFPLERRRWLRALLVHFAIGAGMAVGKFMMDMFIQRFFVQVGLVPVMLQSPMMMYFNFLTYVAIVGAGSALRYYRKYREREQRAAHLEVQLAQAQLQALKMQLHPHFLFNTLHTIAMLNYTDVEEANRVLVLLSDLLRMALDNVDTQEVPLKQELDFLTRYLEIEQTRFRDRLIVRMDIDPTTLDAYVPNLILQPLVENAIRHGVSKKADAGCLEIQVRRVNGQMCMQILDDGPGLPKNGIEEGIGLRTTKARLAQLYGEAHHFDLMPGPSGGVVASLTIPFRTANARPAETNHQAP